MHDHTIAVLAFNNHEMTYRLVKHMRRLGFAGRLLIFDNGSDPPFDSTRIPPPATVHREPENIYVNPAWNRIIERVDTRYVTLLNDDCFVVSPGYFEEVTDYMRHRRIALTTPSTLNVRTIHPSVATSPLIRWFSSSALRFSERYRRQGWLMTIDLQMYRSCRDWRIPDYLKLWYGDDWIWYQIARHGGSAGTVLNRYALHRRDPAGKNPTVQRLIDHDWANLQRYGMDWYRQAQEMWLGTRKYGGSTTVNKVLLKTAYRIAVARSGETP